MLNVILVPTLEDNYTYIIESKDSVAIIDPGEAAPVITVLDEKSLTPSFIFNTHHHWDHVNGNKKLKDKYDLRVIGSQYDKDRVPELDQGLEHGETFKFGDETVEVIATAGHTLGHICLYFRESKILFTGDTLFSLGCGKFFEGTAEDMFKSFEALKKLPDDTQIYCGHEYTLANSKFCLSITPDSQNLLKHIEKIKTLRTNNKPTIPSTLALEKKANVFLMAKTAAELKKLRDLKDNF